MCGKIAHSLTCADELNVTWQPGLVEVAVDTGTLLRGCLDAFLSDRPQTGRYSLCIVVA